MHATQSRYGIGLGALLFFFFFLGSPARGEEPRDEREAVRLELKSAVQELRLSRERFYERWNELQVRRADREEYLRDEEGELASLKQVQEELEQIYLSRNGEKSRLKRDLTAHRTALEQIEKVVGEASAALAAWLQTEPHFPDRPWIQRFIDRPTEKDDLPKAARRLWSLLESELSYARRCELTTSTILLEDGREREVHLLRFGKILLAAISYDFREFAILELRGSLPGRVESRWVTDLSRDEQEALRLAHTILSRRKPPGIVPLPIRSVPAFAGGGSR